MSHLNGLIKYVNTARSFGFITPTTASLCHPDLYFRFEALTGDATHLPKKGDVVVYIEGESPRGPVAAKVYNMADPQAEEEYQADLIADQQRAERQRKNMLDQIAAKEALIEKNRQWHAAREASQRAGQQALDARQQRHMEANRAWHARREAEQAALTGHEQRLLATVRMWGHLTVPCEDVQRVAVVASLEAKGRVAVRRSDADMVVTLVKASV